jgi:hypothetical protein
VDLSDIRRYVERDWGAADRWRVQDATAEDAAVALSRIDAAGQLIRAICPRWPGETARREDLAHHVRLSALLRRVQR